MRGGGVYRVEPTLRYHGGFGGGGCQQLCGLLHQCCRQRRANVFLRLGTRSWTTSISWIFGDARARDVRHRALGAIYPKHRRPFVVPVVLHVVWVEGRVRRCVALHCIATRRCAMMCDDLRSGGLGRALLARVLLPIRVCSISTIGL